MTRTILAVDDSGGLRTMYEALLGPAGYDVRTAADGLQALEAIREQTPDLIVLDLCLPRVSGWDVLAAVRSTPRWSRIPVVVASVLSDPDSVACGWCMDCTWYLPKPLDADDLLLLVGRLLELSPAAVTQPVAATG